MKGHPQARFIIDTLHQAGFVAYYAGGCVRDLLLNHPSDDIDIATNAPPETVQALFPHTIPLGITFGIILVIIDGHEFEVATFRKDLDYHDGRRPSRIAFSTAEEDAKRRDFTINGMFYDPLHDELLDFVGGRDDLQAKVIRAIGNPHERIKEDRLGMIRGIRLACRFAFQIDSATEQATRAHAQELFPAVAIERIVQEFTKGKAFHNLHPMLLMLHEYDLLGAIFPELLHLSPLDLKKRLEPTLRYPLDAPLIAWLLPLFPSFSLDEQIQLIKKLKLSNRDQQFATFLFKARAIVEDDLNKARSIENVEWATLYAHEYWLLALPILASHVDAKHAPAFIHAHEKRLDSLRSAVDRIQRQKPVMTAAILQKAGIAPGKTMGLLLREAERIACNEGIDEPQPLLKRLQKLPIWPC